MVSSEPQVHHSCQHPPFTSSFPRCLLALSLCSEAEHTQVLEEAERMRKVVVEGGEDEKLFAQEPDASVHSVS